MFLRPPNATTSGRPLGSRSFDKLRADWYRYTECLSGDFRSRLEILSIVSARDVELMVNTLTSLLMPVMRTCPERGSLGGPTRGGRDS